MAEKKTAVGQAVSKYVQGVLDDSTKAGDAAMAAGYPSDSRFTQAYYAGVPYLYQYGDEEAGQALDRMGNLYDAYGAAGSYNKTGYGDIAAQYGAAGKYDPTQYAQSDYTTQNIKSRMTPYEELVSDRARARLKKSYDEAGGERQAQALRAGAFGGSGAAVQEEVARRNYLEQMADMDAQNLQSAYEAGVGLYGKEMADNLAAQQATEASRQFAKQTEFSGIEGLMGTRNAEAAQEAAAKEAQFTALQGQGTAAQEQAALAQQKKNMQAQNLQAMQQAGAQQEQTILDRNEYDLGIASQQANILGAIQGSTTPVASTKNKSSPWQTALGVASGVAGIADAIFRDGGIVQLRYADGGPVYTGGGVADIDPTRYYIGN